MSASRWAREEARKHLNMPEPKEKDQLLDVTVVISAVDHNDAGEAFAITRIMKYEIEEKDMPHILEEIGKMSVHSDRMVPCHQ